MAHHTHRRAAAILLLTLPPAAFAQSAIPEPGVSKALAVSRAARLSDLHYALEFSLQEHQSSVHGSETLTFNSASAGDLPLDFRDGTILTAAINGQPIATPLTNGHLILPAVTGRNTVSIAFTANAGPSGKAITRYTDKDDGSEYLYTLFVPMDASMAFPCFDQPDLKARFTLSVDHPATWTVIANTAPGQDTSDGAKGRTTFPATKPISTYLFAFTAGPWATLPGSHPGEPTVFVRKSQLDRARAEAPSAQQTAAAGIHYFSTYFAKPFPFPKYDLVLIPGFPFGGMEHAGATFLNEDSVLFRTAPTQADYFRRKTLILHETCHQWFGDLVTMRWFDDLWLKEGFAQYMAYKALAELEPDTQPWKHFNEDIKPLAYAIDETQGTTPVSQHIANLLDAKSAYGAIVYQKAPSVLKQLNFYLGEQNFRDGLRLYLKQHAYANAEWSDLISAFEATGRKDVQGWARAWILQRGMPQITVNYTCNAGKIDQLTVRQRDILGAGNVWPISSEWLLGYTDYDMHIPVAWNKPVADGKDLDLLGKPCPNYILLNADDYGYGRFLVTGADRAMMMDIAAKPDLGQWMVDQAAHPGRDLYGTPPARHIRKPQFYVDTPLGRSMLWTSLWESVHVAQLAPRAYTELALTALPTESDESLARINGGRISAALHAYLGPTSRAAALPQAEATIADRMIHAPTLNLRIVHFRTFTSIAESPAALGQIKSLLDGSLTIPGLPLKPLDRWNLVGHLIALNDPDAARLFAAERAKDPSGEGQRYAYAIEAGTPDPTLKARYFDQYTSKNDIQEDWLTLSLGPFNSWNQSQLTEPYLARALDTLPYIKQNRRIFFLGAWLSAFLNGQHSPEAQDIVHTWLNNARTDPDLRLKVLEVSDALDRTVTIRAKFPD